MHGIVMGLAAMVAVAGVPAAAQKPFHEGETGGRAGTCDYVYEGQVGDARYEYRVSCDGTGEAIVDGPSVSPLKTLDMDLWEIRGELDQFDDTISWRAYHFQTGLSLTLSGSGRILSACLMRADFPGRPIAIRVGQHEPMRSNTECLSKSLATLQDQLKQGGIFRTRGYEWPYDYARDETGNADQFELLIQLYRHVRASLPNSARR